ncbi:hypothetical protein FHG87_018152 [Trinorchestia longiramus]|nr:hypothetical protein FHG87_018152 [Trinorchestia longiramus]
MDRMKVDKKAQLAHAKYLVRKHIAVVKSPAAGLQLVKKVSKKVTEEDMDDEVPRKESEAALRNTETRLDEEDEEIVPQFKTKSKTKQVQFDDELEEVSKKDQEKKKILENMDVDGPSDVEDEEESDFEE